MAGLEIVSQARSCRCSSLNCDTRCKALRWVSANDSHLSTSQAASWLSAEKFLIYPWIQPWTRGSIICFPKTSGVHKTYISWHCVVLCFKPPVFSEDKLSGVLAITRFHSSATHHIIRPALCPWGSSQLSNKSRHGTFYPPKDLLRLRWKKSSESCTFHLFNAPLTLG